MISKYSAGRIVNGEARSISATLSIQRVFLAKTRRWMRMFQPVVVGNVCPGLLQCADATLGENVMLYPPSFVRSKLHVRSVISAGYRNVM